MKAVIMAAGKGTRLLPLTEKIPKVLVEVNGKPFLWYVIEHLQRAGFSDIGIVVGYKGDQIGRFCTDNGLDVTIIQQPEQKGTGHAVSVAREFVDGGNFVVVAGDNLWSAADLQKLNVDDEYCYVTSYQVEDPSRFGVLVSDGEFLQRIVEKPTEFVGNLVNASAYKFTSEIFDVLEKIGLSERGEIELTDAISLLAAERKVKVVTLQDYWFDLATKDDIVKIGEFLKSKV